MATNASTWFYAEPEHRAYLLEERVNHTLWSSRIGGIYLDCVSENPPFRMTGEWNGRPVTLEWVPNQYLTLTTSPGKDADLLVVGLKEILGFTPTVSYVDEEGRQLVEWHVKDGDQRLREVLGNPRLRSVKRYKG